MARAPRMLLDDRPCVYHVMSHTALDGHPLGDVEKEFLLNLIKRLTSLYFLEVLGFCVMGNHFHLLVKVYPGGLIPDDEVVRRYRMLRGEDAPITEQMVESLRRQWCSLSLFMRDVKQTFSRYYNKRHDRRGYFWGERFKSVIVQSGRTLVHCLAYIDLNPVRAGLVQRPEDYRWCSIGYHLQQGNADGFLSTDFGLAEWGHDTSDDRAASSARLREYRRFLYESGALESGKGLPIRKEVLEKARERGFEYTPRERLLLRTRYFTDSGIIGSRAFVQEIGSALGLTPGKERVPRKVSGLDAIYSYRRLSETL